MSVEWDTHVLDCYPNEAVATVLDGVITPCENIADNPQSEFKIESTILAEREYDSIIHSHPVKPDEIYVESNRLVETKLDARSPSKADMIANDNLNMPVGIVWTNGEVISEPIWLGQRDKSLIGREFIYGHHDCYTCVADYHFKHTGVILPNPPRERGWTNSKEDMYNEVIGDRFVDVDIDDLDIGDYMLYKIKAPVINHVAVVVGPNEILHHMMGRLSCVEPLNKWMKVFDKAVRYVA